MRGVGRGGAQLFGGSFADTGAPPGGVLPAQLASPVPARVRQAWVPSGPAIVSRASWGSGSSGARVVPSVNSVRHEPPGPNTAWRLRALASQWAKLERSRSPSPTRVRPKLCGARGARWRELPVTPERPTARQFDTEGAHSTHSSGPGPGRARAQNAKTARGRGRLDACARRRFPRTQ